MKRELDRNGCLYQAEIVYEIEKRFGAGFIYINNNGNSAIDRKVLKEFRQLTPNVIWERNARCWRPRERHDDPGRMQT